MKKEHYLLMVGSALGLSLMCGSVANAQVQNPMNGTTTVGAIFTAPTENNPELAPGGINNTPTPGTENNDNTNNVPDGSKVGPFALLYQPKSFQFPSTVLKNGSSKTGELDIPLDSTGQHHYHVGVSDKRHTPSGFILTARLTWNNDNTHDMSVSTIETSQNVKSVNTGASLDLTDPSLKHITLDDSISINDSSTPIMTSEKVVNWQTFDGELKNIKLHIPDQTKLQAKSYAGTITWTLADTPK